LICTLPEAIHEACRQESAIYLQRKKQCPRKQTPGLSIEETELI